jgi:hypothetical protein
VVGYLIYRNTSSTLGPEIARTGATTTWTDTSALQSGTKYFYAIKAFDAAGLVGGKSNNASVIVQ